MMHQSFIKYYSDHDGYKCGYCKRSDSNYSHGMWAHTMTVTDYQDLIDRGWRRSGKQCYKPTLDIICCPMYTIRCKALEFKPSKSQKKVLKRFNKFLMGEDVSNDKGRPSSSSGDMAVDQESQEEFLKIVNPPQNLNFADMDIPFIEEDNSRHDRESERKLEDNEINSARSVDSQTANSSITSTVNVNNITQDKSKKATGPDPTKVPCKKAKQARRERMLEKLQKKGVNVASLENNSKNKEKNIEDFINELPNNVKRKLEIKLVRTEPPSPEWLASSKQAHEVYVKYQTFIHGDNPNRCSESNFHDFLVHSPLLEEHTEVSPPCGYGSFHQQYWLDGKIIAVGVIDILPRCISSVYFFYDPQYLYLALGTYGALREIAFTRQLQKKCPELTNYNMGFYIHSCVKMRYKGNYLPSDLLCPETYKWFPIKDCISKLETVKYSRFDPDIDSVDENYPANSIINYIKVLSRGEVLMYGQYKRRVGKKYSGEDEVLEYARLVGTKTAKKMIMVM